MKAYGKLKVMITLVINNSYSKVIGLEPKYMTKLRNLLSYNVTYAQAQYIRDPNKRIKYCIDTNGNFATGLLYLVDDFFKYQGLGYIEDDRRSMNDPVEVRNRDLLPSDREPYVDQIAAVKAALGHIRGVLSCPTGTGKSHIIAMLLARTKLKTLIVVPSLELKAQLTESLGRSLTTMDGISVENIDSKSLKSKGEWDCLIIDEAHHAAAKTYHKLNKTAWSDIRWRYSLTATPFRNNSDEQLLYEGIAGPVIFKLTYLDAVAKGYIVPVEAYYYDLEPISLHGHFYNQIYSEAVVNNESRNELIAGLLKNLYAQGRYTLCLVKEVKHGQILAELTGLPLVTGQDEDSRIWIKRFSNGDLKCLIATEAMLGEGVDTKPCEFVIIAGLGRAKSQFMQKCGRAVRKYKDKESAKIILFRDFGHKWLLTSFRSHSTILKEEYGVKLIKLGVG